MLVIHSECKAKMLVIHSECKAKMLDTNNGMMLY